MYNDSGITDTLWTGSEVGGEWVYPTAHQNLVIRFPTWYLSADDGDFTTNGVTIATQTGDSEDITVGNATSAVLSATMLNPLGTMENAPWGVGTAYIGVVTATASADTQTGLNPHVYYNSIHYGIQSDGTLVKDSYTYAAGGTPKAVVVLSDGRAYYYTSTGAWFCGGSTFSTAISNPYLEAKYQSLEEPIGIQLNASLIPEVVNDVTNNTKTTFANIPMGKFDFSNADAYGVTFNVEAYDLMTLFDADGTDWVQSLDFTTPKTLADIISELMTEMGMSYTISASAVNTTVSWSVNPITSYTVTYRQVLRWLAEAIGCNVRMSRTGTVEFYTFDATPVTTITPDTIISNTRTKNRYTVPQITKVICYNTVGAGYEDGTSGSDYYVVANPFIDPSSGLTPVTNLLGLLDDIPAYYPTSISVACYDPRIDIGDIITIETTDGTTYDMPLMHQSLTWVNTTKANISATGRQVREVPTSMTDGSDLSGVVSSNPKAVVNQIQAVGIDADWITAGTISDRQGYNSWNLDTGYLSIREGELNITYKKTYSHEDYDATDVSTVQNYINGVITSLTDAQWEKYDFIGDRDITSWNKTRIEQMIALQKDTVKTVVTLVSSSVDPNNGIYSSISVPALGTSSGLGVTGTMSGARLYSNYISARKIKALRQLLVDSGGTDTISIDDTNITLKNATYTKTISASGPTPTEDSGSTTLASSSGYSTLATISIPAGTYLIIGHVQFEPNASGRRAALMSNNQNNGSETAYVFFDGRPVSTTGWISCHFSGIWKSSSATTKYLNATQNSGSTLNVQWMYQLVRLA